MLSMSDKLAKVTPFEYQSMKQNQKDNARKITITGYNFGKFVCLHCLLGKLL